MATVGAIRSKHVGATRRLLGVLVALWINMVVQPCAMAAEAEHDCPHCPPAHHEQMSAYHGHGAEKRAAPCAALEAQCGDFGEISVDTRGDAQPIDVEQPDIFVVGSFPEHSAVAERVTSRATGPPSIRPVGRPIYILNCAYLK